MRETGYYWIKFKWDTEFIIGHFEKEMADLDDEESNTPWTVVGNDTCYRESELEEISESPIKP